MQIVSINVTLLYYPQCSKWRFLVSGTTICIIVCSFHVISVFYTLAECSPLLSGDWWVNIKRKWWQMLKIFPVSPLRVTPAHYSPSTVQQPRRQPVWGARWAVRYVIILAAAGGTSLVSHTWARYPQHWSQYSPSPWSMVISSLIFHSDGFRRHIETL